MSESQVDLCTSVYDTLKKRQHILCCMTAGDIQSEFDYEATSDNPQGRNIPFFKKNDPYSSKAPIL